MVALNKSINQTRANKAARAGYLYRYVPKWHLHELVTKMNLGQPSIYPLWNCLAAPVGSSKPLQ